MHVGFILPWQHHVNESGCLNYSFFLVLLFILNSHCDFRASCQVPGMIDFVAFVCCVGPVLCVCELQGGGENEGALLVHIRMQLQFHVQVKQMLCLEVF